MIDGPESGLRSHKHRDGVRAEPPHELIVGARGEIDHPHQGLGELTADRKRRLHIRGGEVRVPGQIHREHQHTSVRVGIHRSQASAVYADDVMTGPEGIQRVVGSDSLFQGFRKRALVSRLKVANSRSSSSHRSATKERSPPDSINTDMRGPAVLRT